VPCYFSTVYIVSDAALPSRNLHDDQYRHFLHAIVVSLPGLVGVQIAKCRTTGGLSPRLILPSVSMPLVKDLDLYWLPVPAPSLMQPTCDAFPQLQTLSLSTFSTWCSLCKSSYILHVKNEWPSSLVYTDGTGLPVCPICERCVLPAHERSYSLVKCSRPYSVCALSCSRLAHN
jgi:hypothetical protein